MKNFIPQYTRIKDTYTISEFLGAGAFGAVYKVRHRYLGFQALKIFNPGSIPKEKEMELFNEAYILSKLTHENVVRVYEANTFIFDNNRYCYIAMEYVNGSSLDTFLESKGNISIDLALHIQIGICTGLAQAHKLNPPVVHRDVKPQNIMISQNNDNIIVKVSDFGLAKHVDPITRLTESGGTLAYLPPEGFWNYVSPASDVFSAGIIFYLMLTGIAPYEISGNYKYTQENEIHTAIKGSRNKLPPPPSKYNDSLDNDVDKIALKALSPDIKQRYQDAELFLNDIEQYIKLRNTLGDEEIQKALSLGKQYTSLKEAVNLLEVAISKQSKEKQKILKEKYRQTLENWKKGILM